MIVILLAVLGIPLWMVLGALGAGLWSRRSFSRAPGVFAVKCQLLHDSTAAPRWPRRAVYARWVHDVLIVRQGLALIRTRVLPVAGVSPVTIGRGEVRGFGDDAVGVRVRLDGGEVVAVAAASGDRDTLIGPFSDRLSTTSI